jgi:hypothetical protein
MSLLPPPRPPATDVPDSNLGDAVCHGGAHAVAAAVKKAKPPEIHYSVAGTGKDRHIVHEIVGTLRGSTRAAGRNDPCPCGSGKKYKKCHGSSKPKPHQPPRRKQDILVPNISGARVIPIRTTFEVIDDADNGVPAAPEGEGHPGGN